MRAKKRASGFGGVERWNGMVEWNAGLEHWNATPTLVVMRTRKRLSFFLMLARQRGSETVESPITLSDSPPRKSSRTKSKVRFDSPVKVLEGEEFR